MKKNIILLLLVFLLGVLAYLQQELKFFSPSDQLNLSSNVESISYRHGELVLGRNGYQFKDFPYPLQNEKIEALIKDLNQIRLLKTIEIKSEELKNFFPDENNFFVIDKTEIRLGDKVPGSAQFYFSVKRDSKIQYYIATYELPKTDQTYMLSEDDKFVYIWGIFNFPRMEWYDKNFIKNKIGTVLRVDSNHYSKKPFSLSFRDSKVLPESFKGIAVNKEKMKEYQGQLLNTVFKEITVTDQSLQKPVADLSFETNGMQKKLKLYSEFKAEPGYYAQFENDQYVYSLDENNAKIFYANQSDFWIKTPLPRELKKASRFSLELSQDDKNYKLFTINEDEKVSPSENVNEMIRLFLGIAPYEEADRVSDLAKDYKEDLIFKRGKGLYCRINQQKFYLTVHKDEILLASLHDRYILHYYIRGDRRPLSTLLAEY